MDGRQAQEKRFIEGLRTDGRVTHALLNSEGWQQAAGPTFEANRQPGAALRRPERTPAVA